jgi:hypothetical protein
LTQKPLHRTPQKAGFFHFWILFTENIKTGIAFSENESTVMMSDASLTHNTTQQHTRERAMSKPIRISQTKHANGILGYDFGCRTHFETICLGSKGIGVRLQKVKGPSRYMVVTGCSTHEGAYEIARALAPACECEC